MFFFFLHLKKKQNIWLNFTQTFFLIHFPSFHLSIHPSFLHLPSSSLSLYTFNNDSCTLLLQSKRKKFKWWTYGLIVNKNTKLEDDLFLYLSHEFNLMSSLRSLFKIVSFAVYSTYSLSGLIQLYRVCFNKHVVLEKFLIC